MIGIIIVTLILAAGLMYWFFQTEPEAPPPEEIPAPEKKKRRKKKTSGGPKLNFSKSSGNRGNKKNRVKGGGALKHPLLLSPLVPHNDQVHNIAISADGKFLATCSSDKDVRVWKLDSDSNEFKYTRINIKNDFATAVVFGPDNKYVAVALDGYGFPIRFYKMPSAKTIGKKVHVHKNQKKNVIEKDESLLEFPSNHKSRVTTLLVAPKNVYMLTCASGQDVTIKLWEPRTGDLIHTIKTKQMANYHAAMSVCGRFITAATMMSHINIWEVFGLRENNVNRVKLAISLKGHKASVHSVKFSGLGLDGEIFAASASKDGTWKLWDIGVRSRTKDHNDPTMLKEFEVGKPVDKIAISPSREHPIVAVGIGPELRFYNSKSEKLLDTVPRAHGGNITRMWFNGDGKMLVTAGTDNNVKVWKIPSEK